MTRGLHGAGVRRCQPRAAESPFLPPGIARFSATARTNPGELFEKLVGDVDADIRLLRADDMAAQPLRSLLGTENAGVPVALALARDDPGNAIRHLSEAILLLDANGESYRVDLATAWYNLATAQMKLSDPAMAASSYLKARDIEADIYGEDHPDLISTEYSLAAALSAGADFAAGEAIGRSLRIIRRGGPQARIWRDRALRLAIIIDLADG